MKNHRTFFKKNAFFTIFIIGTALSLVFLILSIFPPRIFSPHSPYDGIDQIRKKTNEIKNEFSELISDINEKKQLISPDSFPEEKDKIFALFKDVIRDKKIEGIGYYGNRRNLVLWFGNVFDLNLTFTEEEVEHIMEHNQSSILVINKASIYLISLKRLKKEEFVIFYRLLAFIPEFKASYLTEYHFLKPKLLNISEIYYWDFREDISGFENLFSRHDDEYISHSGLRDDIQTILFPIRNEQNKILATVTISNPSASSKISGQKENFLFVFYVLIWISLFFLVVYLIKIQFSPKNRKLLYGLFVILILIGLRLILIPLSTLKKIQFLPLFSPSDSSFISFINLCKSPADIFLTSITLLLIMSCLFYYSRDLLKKRKLKKPWVLSLAVNFILIAVSLFFIFIFQKILSKIVFHSNINLLNFSLDLSFFALHFSIIFLFSFCILAIIFIFRIVKFYSFNIYLPFFIFLLEFGVYIFIFDKRNIIWLNAFQGIILCSILLLSFYPEFIAKRKEVLFLMFLFVVFFVHFSLNAYTTRKKHRIIQYSLQHIIKSKDQWGAYFLNQSLQVIDQEREIIISFLKDEETFDLAKSLWERTLMSKFNWYSSLEIQKAEGAVLSRFSLNVPSDYHISVDQPITQDWSLSRWNIPYMGKDKEFLIAYRDFIEEDTHLGRITVYLSIDYDMMPFLYSANPYFELTRASSIPSLYQIELGFLIFDLDGKLLFNPNRISAGIHPQLLKKIKSSKTPLWTTFEEKNNEYNSFFFKKEGRIFSLFLKKYDFFSYSVEFFKLFFLYLIIVLFFILFFRQILKRESLKDLFWSFSNRVYISFIAIALIPLLLFTFSTRSFFNRVFTEKLTEKAEERARIAQRVMEDFIFLQEEAQASHTLPAEDVMLWVSSTISNDVNLYQDGRLVSSSHQEFFDSGLLPEIIDGEIYYKIKYENNSFYTKTQKIGDYSFYNLTVPYFFRDSILFISLPFPLEQQELSKSTEELIEFLFFISTFFIALVLVLARAIGSMIVTPIRKLLVGTKEASLGNLEISIKHNSQDEMRTLVDNFNSMIRNLKKHKHEITEMSRKVAWADIARKVAHEIKNPLTPIHLSAEHLLKVYEDKNGDFDKALKESVSYIIKEVEHLRNTAQRFLELSKKTSIKKEPFDLKQLVRETVDPYKNMLSERIRFLIDFDDSDLILTGDRTDIQTVLRNIFTNAIEAIPEKGCIEIKAGSENNKIAIEINDTGIGMNKHVLNNIFKPDFSTKDAGTGIGLSISKKIIEDHDGSIKVWSQRNKGTRILITFPVEK